MTNWYDLFNVDTKTIADIQSKIQTVDAMTTTQIKDFMSQATTVITTNLAKTGLVDFVDPNGEIMKWRINTTTEVEERLLDALDTITSSDLKIQCKREIPGHLYDLMTKNIVAFLVDTFIGLPYQPTRTLKTISERGNQLSANLNTLWNKNNRTIEIIPEMFDEIPDIISQPTFGKLRGYTTDYINNITEQLRIVLDDELTSIFKQYIDGKTDELSSITSEYIDDLIYNAYVAYLTRTRTTLMTAYAEMGYDATIISNYYDEVLSRELYNTSVPATGRMVVSMFRNTGELEIVRYNGFPQLREKIIDYSYDNSEWCNRISRTMVGMRYAISQGNQYAIAILAFAATAFMDIPGIFEPRGFTQMTKMDITTFDDFVIEYSQFIQTLPKIQPYIINDVSYTGDISNNVMTVPTEPYTSGSEVVLKFQYDLYKNTGGYIYLYERTSQKSILHEYREEWTNIDARITSSNIFKFGLEDGSAIANTIVSVSRAVDKTALTLAVILQIGARVASPVVLPGAYLAGLGRIILQELWWKLGFDDLTTTFRYVPPPFGCVIALLQPIYSTGAIAKYPVLATMNKIGILGIHIQQFISKCIRDGLFVPLLQDSNVRFLGVNFLMTPVYSSTGIIDGTQMKRILNDKSYARLLALQILSFRYQECEKIINDFTNEVNATTSAVQLNPTTRDRITRDLSPSFLKILQNCVIVTRTDNYIRNDGQLRNPINIPMNTIDLQFYENHSLTSLQNSAEEVLREYEIDTTISEGDITIAIKNIRTQYVKADTFKSHIYLTDRQATTQNGYFLRGVDMTDNGMLKNIQTEIDRYFGQSGFMTR